MVVYADLLFFINFVFDLEILAVLLKLLSKKICLWRLLLSACLGGLWSACVFVPYFRLLYSPPMRFFVPFLLTAAVLCPCRMIDCIKAWAAFLGISFVFGGAMSFFGVSTAIGMLLFLPIFVCIAYFKRTVGKRKYQTILEYNGKKITLDGFWDSGNMMSYMGHPVILANEDVFCKFFGSNFKIEALCEWVDVENIRYVPFCSLGNSGVVSGIKLDSVKVCKKYYTDVILGCYKDKFSEELILNGSMI